jgi:RNA polymerase sigma-70 factor (ECF subfamily)
MKNEISSTVATRSGEELYRCFLDGDNSAFELLVEMYEDELSRFIYGIVRDFHETEHLVIDTFTQFVLNKKPFEGKSTLKTYIFAIAKNLTSQHMKKRKRERHISFEEIAELNVDTGETIQVILEKEDRKAKLVDAMRELKKEYHAVLLLLYFEEMSYKQAGQAMKKSEKQIKDLAYRAKKALKKKLEENEEFQHESVNT